jgi:hypothetical protein
MALVKEIMPGRAFEIRRVFITASKKKQKIYSRTKTGRECCKYQADLT